MAQPKIGDYFNASQLIKQGVNSMSNKKRIWGILGSSAIVLLAGIFQSSVHAAPAVLVPTAPVAAPPLVNSIVPNRAQAVNVNQLQRTPLSNGIEYFSQPANLVHLGGVIGQILLALYGISMICVGRGAGAASKSRANVVWGSLFVLIALTAPELISWVMTNSAAMSSDAGVVLPRAGGCG